MAIRKESGSCLECKKVTGFMRRQIRAFGLELLKAVGEGQTKFEAGEIAFHLRRKVSQKEYDGLPVEWCRAPSIDDGGNMTLIEWIPEQETRV